MRIRVAADTTAVGREGGRYGEPRPQGDDDAPAVALELVLDAVLQRLGLGEAADEEDEARVVGLAMTSQHE